MDGNIDFLAAGYALTWIVLAWYARRLVRRTDEAVRALENRKERHEEPA